MTSLQFQMVSKWYGQVSALTDLNVDFQPGVTGLVGQNGAGKSTMMKLASGLLRPSFGQVFLDGAPPTSPKARQVLGYCPDIDRYYEHMSGQRFVTWMLRLAGMSGSAARKRADATLTELGLGEARVRRISGYSKGMRQRVKLAVALGHSPKVLLLDEPLTGLDPIARQEMTVLMKRMGDAGSVVIVSSHVLHELQNIADQIVLVHQGRKLAEGSVAEIRATMADRPRRVFLRTEEPRLVASRLFEKSQVVHVSVRVDGLEIATSGGRQLDPFLTELGASGLIREIQSLDDSLESVFEYLVQ